MGVGIYVMQPPPIDASPAELSASARRPTPTPAPTPPAALNPSVLPAAAPVTLEPRPQPPKPKKRVKPSAAPTPTPEPAVPAASFVISTFNVLGGSHTSSGGNKSGYASGPTRMQNAVHLIERHGVDVVGFQELEQDQLYTFQRMEGSRYAVYPGMALGKSETRNSLAWRSDMWQLVKAEHIGIPYFDGNIRQMPVVLLRHRATGRQAWFANFHNPASTRRVGNQQHWRDVATSREIELANRLRETGIPVFFTGDMNERAEYFCRFTGGAPMDAANGGSNDGACRPPSEMGIDWIFGSHDVSFSGWFADRSDLVRRTTDHPMVVSRAVIAGQ